MAFELDVRSYIAGNKDGQESLVENFFELAVPIYVNSKDDGRKILHHYEISSSDFVRWVSGIRRERCPAAENEGDR